MKLISLLFFLSFFSANAFAAKGFGEVAEYGQQNAEGMKKACQAARRRAFEDLNDSRKCEGTLGVTFQPCTKLNAATADQVKTFVNIKEGDFEYRVKYDYNCP
jgi:hypothetical protein